MINNLICQTNKDLCTRCGMCVGVCPVNSFIFDNKLYPQPTPECIDCMLCKRVCPGESFDVDLFSQKLFGKPYILKNELGYFNNAFVGYATDKDLKMNATSGGVITGILISLLENKKIDGAIVTSFDEHHPENPKPIIARTIEKLIKSAGSKYTIVSQNSIFNELRKLDEHVALVGLPCHVQAFRLLSETSHSLSNKVSLVIGLYCAGTIEQQATLSLINMLGVPLTEIREIKYRGGQWPGEFQVFRKNGACLSFPREIFIYLSRLYVPKRCLTCIDYSSEFADISVADAWIKEKGKWKYPGGCSIILERTQIGREALELARNSSHLNIQEISREIALETHRGSSTCRKNRAIVNINEFKKRRKSYPNYGILMPSMSYKNRKEKLRHLLVLLMAKLPVLRKVLEFIAFKLVGESTNPEKMSSKSRLNKLLRQLLWRVINALPGRWYGWG